MPETNSLLDFAKEAMGPRGTSMRAWVPTYMSRALYMAYLEWLKRAGVVALDNITDIRGGWHFTVNYEALKALFDDKTGG